MSMSYIAGFERRCSGRSRLLDRNHVEADRKAIRLEIAGVLEHAERGDAAHLRESRLHQKSAQDFLVESHIVKVVRIDLPAEHHPHGVPLDLRRGPRTDEQMTEHIEIRHRYQELAA